MGTRRQNRKLKKYPTDKFGNSNRENKTESCKNLVSYFAQNGVIEIINGIFYINLSEELDTKLFVANRGAECGTVHLSKNIYIRRDFGCAYIFYLRGGEEDRDSDEELIKWLINIGFDKNRIIVKDDNILKEKIEELFVKILSVATK